MNLSGRRIGVLRLIGVLVCAPLPAAAQMTIDGIVTSTTGAPVQGASVTIAALDLSTRTSAEGRYNFIVRSSQVRGQTVEIVARHARFGSQIAQIAITGGAVTQNFVLGSTDRERPPRTEEPDRPRDTAALDRNPPLDDVAESTAPDLPSAVAGRFAALRVAAAPTPGGSASLLYRGLRTLVANPQPLVVIDGVPVENTSFATESQRFGLGGFDYGTPLQDIAVEDIESVRLMPGALAALTYGSRAANGVVLVRTKSGREITGIRMAARQRFGMNRAMHVTEYQNAYGQGLGGAYEFFDGQGGGINDDVAQNWGPKLDGRPLPQHSLAEPMRPEVRHWLPRANNVRDYFENGRTLDGTIAVLGSRESLHGRAALNLRHVNGLTPNSTTRRLGLTVSAGAQPLASLSATLNLQIIGANASNRPGSGFDDINPVAGFMTMGRQVDVDALRANVTDEDGAQINWIYTDRNNPFFATTRNANEDDRRQMLAGLNVRYAFTPAFDATVTAGTHDVSESRNVGVASGWIGGFPTSLGRRAFVGGGSDESSVDRAERFASLALNLSRAGAGGLALTGSLGGEMRSMRARATALVSGIPATGGTPAVSNSGLESDHDVTAAFVSAGMSRGSAFDFSAGARLEQSSSLPRSYSVVYPSVTASFDLASIAPALTLGNAKLVGRWWKAGNEITRSTLGTIYYGAAGPTELDGELRPEVTSVLEVGAQIASPDQRVGLEVTGYRERTTDVLVATTDALGAALLSQTGEIFNGGIEAALRATVLNVGSFSWELAGGVARNANTVDRLRSDQSQVVLSPATFGGRLAARVGSSAGVILGSRLLRDETGALLLKDGLPIPDASEPFAFLGSVQPDWSASAQSRLRWHGAELFFLLDGRFGGKVFSATNMMGSFAGSLKSTLIGDRSQPSTGETLADSLVVPGIDSASGLPSAFRVSAEQYFHALGSITEPWVYDASFAKLREVRLSYELPTRFLAAFREHRLKVTLAGRNLLTWAEAPNIDPEGVFSTGIFRGFELGQLPHARSVVLQLSIAP